MTEKMIEYAELGEMILLGGYTSSGKTPAVYLLRHSVDIIGGVKDTAAAVATCLPSLSVNNLEAYIMDTVRWISPELAEAYEDALATANKSRLSGLSGNALTQRINTLFDMRSVELGENGAAAISALYEAGWKGAVPSDTPGSISVNKIPI